MKHKAGEFLRRLWSGSWQKKTIIILLLVAGIWFGWQHFSSSLSKKSTYTTATVERGTVVSSVTGSGTVSTANNASITTKASGVVSTVYVKDGDVVAMGDKIAEIQLDQPGQQAADAALASYQSAQNAVAAAQATMYTLQSDMFSKWDTQHALATNSTYSNNDGTANDTNRVLVEYQVADKDWLAAEAKYKNQQAVVVQAQMAIAFLKKLQVL